MRYWITLAISMLIFASIFGSLPPERIALWSLFFLGCGLCFLGYVIASGIRARGGDREDVAVHKAHIGTLTAFVLIGVTGVEVLVRKMGGLWGEPWFVAFHLMLVGGLAVTYSLARFRYTGLRSATHHKRLVYLCIGFFCGTSVTGGMLLTERFPLSTFQVSADERDH